MKAAQPDLRHFSDSRAPGSGPRSLDNNRADQAERFYQNGQAVTWGYDGSGQRVMQFETVNGQPQWTFWLYDIQGKRMAQIGCVLQSGNSVCTNQGVEVYFGSRLIMRGLTWAWQNGAWTIATQTPVVTDRLGSVRAYQTNGTWRTLSYFPFGEEKTPVTPDGAEKFGTYIRDSTTPSQDYAMQRYYSPNLGRFHSPDPGGIATANPRDPSSWNRYSYVQGDPVNRFDPKGLYAALPSCYWNEDDPECADDGSGGGPCDPNDSAMFGFLSFESGCFGGGGPVNPVTSPPPKPKCWQNTDKIDATLVNLGTDIEHDVAGAFSAADLQLLTADVNSDVSKEEQAIGGGTTSSPFYIGGHFNLNLDDTQVLQFSVADQAIFNADFRGNNSDGVRQAGSTGLAGAYGYTLHSQDDKVPDLFSFHFDRYNRNSGLAGAIGHAGYDWIGGHLGHPCLDPAWHH